MFKGWKISFVLIILLVWTVGCSADIPASPTTKISSGTPTIGATVLATVTHAPPATPSATITSTLPAAGVSPAARATATSTQVVSAAAPTALLKSSETPNPSHTPIAGAFALKGTATLETISDTVGSDGTNHQEVRMKVDYTAQSVGGNQLIGTGQATYRHTYRVHIQTQVESCGREWTSGDLTWNVNLGGTFQQNADGSIFVSLLPTDGGLGPEFEIPSPCTAGSAPGRATMPTPLVGTLVNGKFDQTFPIPHGTYTIHMELASNK